MEQQNPDRGASVPETQTAILKMVFDWQERQAAETSAQTRRELRWRNLRAVVFVLSICITTFVSIAALRADLGPNVEGPYVALVRINGLIESGSPAGGTVRQRKS